MFRNYLAAALRNLVRNRMYSVINIAGLAVGLAAAILIAAFVRYEVGYDTWIPGHERVYRISTDLRVTSGAGYAERTVGIPIEAASWLTVEVPEAEAVSRFMRMRTSVRRDGRETEEMVAWVEPDFLKLVPLPAVAGQSSAALGPGDAIITQRLARALFDRNAPIGETLEIGRKHSLRVVAVVADFPQDTTLDADIITSTRASFSPTAASDAIPADRFRGFDFTPTLVRLQPGADVAGIEARLREALKRRYPAELPGGVRFTLAFDLVPIADVHLDPALGGGNTAAIKALAAVGVLIALVAIINFVNLMTARATRRAVEVGARKTAGAARLDLLVQFVGEAMVYVALAATLALALAELSLPSLSGFLQLDLSLDYAPLPLAVYAAGVVVVGVLAGAYPALVLSRLPPLAALRDERTEGRPQLLRQGLVVGQFAIVIALGLATGTIYLQTRFAMAENMRLAKDQILLIRTSCGETFKREVAALPGVRGAACSSATMTGAINGTPGELPGGNKIVLSRAAADYGLLELYDQKPLAGRFFSRDFASDGADAYGPGYEGQQPVVVNESLVRGLGLASAGDAIGRSLLWINQPAHGLTPRSSIIIGVVADFATRSVDTPIEPMAFFIDPDQSQLLHVKLEGEAIPETLDAIDGLWRRFGDDRPIRRFFFSQHVEDMYRGLDRQGTLLAGFTGAAILIACLGLFGLAALTAEQRTKEIGIRKSMGATRADILRLMLWQFTKPVLWANFIAWPAAYLIMRRWLDGFAYRIDLEPWMFLAASALALAIALATVIGHALMVSRARPVAALRYE